MFGEVNIEVQDGNLGRNTSTGSFVQVKIGASTSTSTVPVLVTNTMKPEEIKEKLGCTPLADACIDATENGLKKLYAIPVKADVDGTIGEVTKTGESKGTVTASGKPNNAYDVVVKITATGKVNKGSFAYSIDGGNNFSDEYTIPLGGTFELPGTGITLTFADSGEEEESFMEEDAFSFSSTAPTLSNSGVLKAVESLISFNSEFEIVHIVGTSGKTLWAALAEQAKEFLETYKKPCIFLCEGRSCGSEESLDEYLAAMKTERKGINSYFVSVVLSYGVYTRKDLRTQTINFAGIVSGLLGQAKESLSIGCVKEFPISCSKLQKLLPEGIEEYTKELDALGYITLRQYTGKEDYYVTNANVLAADGSDFPYIENVRVLNRIVREVSKKATDNIQAEIDPDNIEASIKPFEADLGIAIDNCIKDKIISSGLVTIETENVNILVDETLNVSIEWVPMGTVRKFNLTFAVNNPYGAGAE
mgnify:FL=1